MFTPSNPDAAPVDMQPGLSSMCIEQEHSFVNCMDMVIVPYICLWTLLQVDPSGTILVPLRRDFDSQTAYREYFNPLGGRPHVSDNNIISVKIDGEYRSKIGVRPYAARNGLAYLRDDGDGDGVLYVVLFEIDPGGIYVDKSWGGGSDYGDTFELYNDDGDMGGFAEIECHGPARKVAAGDTQSHAVRFYMFGGRIASLMDVGTVLLGADIGHAVYFSF